VCFEAVKIGILTHELQNIKKAVALSPSQRLAINYGIG
tara:strand:+ start:4995 stop:5108 length:114 start_codon:yes stop_codon:yes gene_type:complete